MVARFNLRSQLPMDERGPPVPRPRGAPSAQFTGQTWTLPNVLVDYDATDDRFDPAAQGTYLTIE